ncbi:Zinc finger HIT domain-containing protein 1 [Mycena venus]|uniref:Zinc finger HIT domain-containing protein 1 n=1 Tax=Mycena venus TaxID=2733690 RepID=A0A8H6WX86_9AGAR|nr:Zinc finger HIT domain-containing protein 1 [Mycena venus]
MPPRRGREHHARQAHNSVVGLTSEVIAKRTKRHLDELERSNYAEPSAHVGEEDEEGKYTKGRARQLISEKRAFNIPGNFATLLEESNLVSFPPTVPTYLTAEAPAPTYPPRLICSVCGYWGRYKCRRCALPYCDLNCEGVHAETRCERRVL